MPGDTPDDTPGERLGEAAERRVEARVREAVAAYATGVEVFANVPILAKTRPDDPSHDAEADLVLVDPAHGLLVIEVKSGEPLRRRDGRWFIGGRELGKSPFVQAMKAKHDLAEAIEDLPDWTVKQSLGTAHAVAFPSADLSAARNGEDALGPEGDRAILLDASDLEDPRAAHLAIERAWRFHEGNLPRGLGARDVAIIRDYLAPEVRIPRLIRRDVAEAKDRLISISRAQELVLNQNRKLRRASVVGPAGSGKSLLAVEKARRLAREGWRTLYLCFNSMLASAVMHEIAAGAEPEARRPTVSTFHGLCETLGARAGTLGAKPAKPGQDWFDVALPAALDDAITALPDTRFDAVIVDEGQDFRLGWLESIEFLFDNPADGVFWVFHDPGQALSRDDEVAKLGLQELDLFEDYRSPAPVAALSARFYRGPGEPVAVNPEGMRPVIVAAKPGRDTTEEVRRRLHDLLVTNGVKVWDIVVLSGSAAHKSLVWRQRTFGAVELWSGAIDADGQSLGLPADQVPEMPSDDGVVRFETVRRFKGLESPVVILCELPTDEKREDQLLYTALTRATAHLIVIAPPALAGRLSAALSASASAPRAGSGAVPASAPRPLPVTAAAVPHQVDTAAAKRDPR